LNIDDLIFIACIKPVTISAVVFVAEANNIDNLSCLDVNLGDCVVLL
jgi:hypothetical protein